MAPPDPLFWSLFFLSVVAPYRVQAATTNSTSSAASSAATTGSSSSSRFSSSSFHFSSSFSSQLPSSSASHSSSIVHSSKSTLTSVTTSSTSVISTATSSSSSSVHSSVLTSSSTHSTSHTSVVFIQTVPSATRTTSQVTILVPVTTASNEPSTSPSVATNQQVATASKGFWSNKGAVGGTFTVVALAIVGLFAALVLFLRRRAARRRSARDTFFDTKNTFEGNDRLSTGPSMISLGDQPMDAHSTPVPNYGATYLVDTADYSITYPPGTSYPTAPEHNSAARQYYPSAEPAAPVSQQQYYPTAPDQLYIVEQDPYYAEYYATNSGAGTTQHDNQQPLSYPHATGPSATVARDSAGYQQSIDSFYGGGAAGMAM